MKVVIRVVANLPTDVTREMFRDYVCDAVTSWDGQLETPNIQNDWTGDPLWRISEHIKDVK